MDEQTEKKGIKHLEHIEGELEEIKNRQPVAGSAFAYGLLQGAGALIGGILALALLGWALSFFGVIPGLGTITKYLQDVVSSFRR